MGVLCEAEMSLERLSLTAQELEALIGENVRARRLQRNIEQSKLAAQAGVSVHALQNLEGGKGTSLRTLVSVTRALGSIGWIEAIAPKVSINPLTLPVRSNARQRASARREKSSRGSA